MPRCPAGAGAASRLSRVLHARPAFPERSGRSRGPAPGGNRALVRGTRFAGGPSHAAAAKRVPGQRHLSGARCCHRATQGQPRDAGVTPSPRGTAPRPHRTCSCPPRLLVAGTRSKPSPFHALGDNKDVT